MYNHHVETNFNKFSDPERDTLNMCHQHQHSVRIQSQLAEKLKAISTNIQSQLAKNFNESAQRIQSSKASNEKIVANHE